jgi:hypothetical protein
MTLAAAPVRAATEPAEFRGWTINRSFVRIREQRRNVAPSVKLDVPLLP